MWMYAMRPIFCFRIVVNNYVEEISMIPISLITQSVEDSFGQGENLRKPLCMSQG